jgi:transposase
MNGSTASASRAANRLLVGDDVSSVRNDVCILTATGEVLLNHQPFANDQVGYVALRDTVLATFQHAEAGGVDFAAEAPGWYWFHTLYALAHDPELAGLDLHLSLFNPRLTHAVKKAMASRDHSDPKDARGVAERTRFARAAHPPVLDDTWLGRRLLTRHYYHLSHALAAEKTYFSAFLFLKASAYRQLQLFTDVFGATSSALITQYSTLQELAALPLAELEGLLKTLSHNHVPDIEEKAQRLHAVAAQSFPVPPHMLEPLNLVLHATLDHIRFLEQQLEETQTAIERAFANVVELGWLMSIPGMGLILAACLLAELCPFDRFFEGTVIERKTGRPRPKNARDAEASIAKWVGLWWPRNQSGTFEGEITRMPKDGNRYARYALIQLANCLREHSAEFAAYYARKHAESKTHAHKRALVLSARKAIGLIVALLHTGQLYRTPEPYREVLSPHQARGQAAATSAAATDP